MRYALPRIAQSWAFIYAGKSKLGPRRMFSAFAYHLAVFLCVAALTSGAVAQSTTDNVKRIQDRWMQCLKTSFQINRKNTPDPNLAAERAFQACATEEE